MSQSLGSRRSRHPLTRRPERRSMRGGRQRRRRGRLLGPHLLRTESPLTGFGAGGFMLVHDGDEAVLVDFFVAAGGADGAERNRGARPDPGLHRRDGRRPSTAAPPRAACRATRRAPARAPALRLDPDRTARGARYSLRPRRGPRSRRSRTTSTNPAPILTSTPESAALYAPEGDRLGEGDVFRFPENVRRARALRVGGGGRPSTRGDGPDRLRLGARAGRDSGDGRHARLRADRAPPRTRAASAGMRS